MSQYLNTTDVSIVLNCTQRNVQRLVREGQLKPLNPHHKRGYLFDKSKIDEFAMKRKEAHHE